MKFGRLLHNFSLDAEEPECLLDYNMLKKKLKASAASLHQEGTGGRAAGWAGGCAGGLEDVVTAPILSRWR